MERLCSPHVKIAASRSLRAIGKKSMSSTQREMKPIPAFCCMQRMRQQPATSRLSIQTSLCSLSASTMLFRGIQNRQKYIDINKVASKLGDDVCTALVSVFAGKGKIGALTITMKENAHQQCFSDLGQSWDISQNLLRKLQSFTCAMYISRGTASDINGCRYHLFCAKMGEVNSSQLPPCLHCLSQRAQCAQRAQRAQRANISDHCQWSEMYSDVSITKLRQPDD